MKQPLALTGGSTSRLKIPLRRTMKPSFGGGGGAVVEPDWATILAGTAGIMYNGAPSKSVFYSDLLSTTVTVDGDPVRSATNLHPTPGQTTYIYTDGAGTRGLLYTDVAGIRCIQLGDIGGAECFFRGWADLAGNNVLCEIVGSGFEYTEYIVCKYVSCAGVLGIASWTNLMGPNEALWIAPTSAVWYSAGSNTIALTNGANASVLKVVRTSGTGVPGTGTVTFGACAAPDAATIAGTSPSPLNVGVSAFRSGGGYAAQYKIKVAFHLRVNKALSAPTQAIIDAYLAAEFGAW